MVGFTNLLKGFTSSLDEFIHSLNSQPHSFAGRRCRDQDLHEPVPQPAAGQEQRPRLETLHHGRPHRRPRRRRHRFSLRLSAGQLSSLSLTFSLSPPPPFPPPLFLPPPLSLSPSPPSLPLFLFHARVLILTYFVCGELAVEC